MSRSHRNLSSGLNGIPRKPYPMPEIFKERLIVFTRYPETGKTKTRLIPALGPHGAAELQRRMTERAVENMVGLQSLRKTTLEVRYEGGSQEQMESWLGSDALLTPQGAGSLDRRMHSAFEDAFATGCRKVVIIGTDIPGITATLVAGAFRRLQKQDLVLGPAADGGYYLIGLRKAAFDRARPLLSAGIPWGTERVLQMTLKIAEEYGLGFTLLETLKDIDRPEDLLVWEEASRITPATCFSERISVIIPTLNEADHIEATLRCLQGARNVEVIVVDGGSSDGTPRVARELGAEVLRITRGRAFQMNAGAAVSTGDILLFLHADTKLPQGFEVHVVTALRKPGVSAGAFGLCIDSPVSSLRIMERIANLRSRYAQMPYGDQGIFVSAALFRQVGGFPEMPIMEDFEFIRRLKRIGRIEIAPAAVQTSARRWLSVGIWRTWWINQLVVAGYYLGISPQRLTAFYRRQKGLG